MVITEKELLTNDCIEKDLKDKFCNIMKIFLVVTAICVLPCVLMLPLVYMNAPRNFLKFIVLIFALLLITALVFAFLFFKFHKNPKETKVVTDTLIGYSYGPTSSLSNPENKNHTLSFSSYGFYYVRMGEHYRWSKLYCMKGNGVVNYSKVGDKFYLAVDKKGRILEVYNCKMFEFKL